ncbi:hypothetical protein G7Y89_g14156 [Cudoniella acicularis]|uniref:RelA/SpoT domain-containing protein n=1 Tax=Cudoniella acicularis TaxID=354080 RepID=A0A8H4R7X8_9HELO|nr:hypothetical protein G7Y89_g14156 [Cudoniella acicularis]
MDETTFQHESTNDPIASFVSDWVHTQYFYSEAASLAHDLCETLLTSNGIRAIVTHRVKQGNRLETKLRDRARHQGKNYKNSNDIRDDIVDLAGVRIALYFPSDREKIGNIMRNAFADVKHKVFPEEEDRAMSVVSTPSTSISGFRQRFQGYSADHYRVRMKVENLAMKKPREDFQKSNPVIEIQVASVLMHAWAEIDHDLVYKTLTSGPASREELRLLDATNGLVHTGEVLLQQLQTAMDTRVEYQKESFKDQFELQSFLRTQIKATRKNASMEHLDILFLVLKLLDLNSPWKLGEKLEGLVISSKSSDSIALTVIERVLGLLEQKEDSSGDTFLHSRLIDVDDLKVDKRQSKYYVVDSSTRDKVLDEREILERAVHIADIMRFPQKSILVMDGMPTKFRHFLELYHSIHFATVQPRGDISKSKKWMMERSFNEMNPLWTWFERNEDILFRVAFQLARLSLENVVDRLVDLRPLSGFQRHATMPQDELERQVSHLNSGEFTENMELESEVVAGGQSEDLGMGTHENHDKKKYRGSRNELSTIESQVYEESKNSDISRQYQGEHEPHDEEDFRQNSDVNDLPHRGRTTSIRRRVSKGLANRHDKLDGPSRELPDINRPNLFRENEPPLREKDENKPWWPQTTETGFQPRVSAQTYPPNLFRDKPASAFMIQPKPLSAHNTLPFWNYYPGANYIGTYPVIPFDPRNYYARRPPDTRGKAIWGHAQRNGG